MTEKQQRFEFETQESASKPSGPVTCLGMQGLSGSDQDNTLK